MGRGWQDIATLPRMGVRANDHHLHYYGVDVLYTLRLESCLLSTLQVGYTTNSQQALYLFILSMAWVLITIFLVESSKSILSDISRYLSPS